MRLQFSISGSKFKFSHTVLACAALAVSGAAFAQKPEVSKWNATDHIARKDFVMQSHRGAGDLAPENTIEAFEMGWSMGTVPEADVRMTTDGVIVAFHDNTFERVVKDIPADLKTKGVKDVTWEVLEKMDVGSWKSTKFKNHKVVKIEDVYKVMQKDPAKRLYLDIKNVDFPALAELTKKYGVEKQAIFTSSKYDQLLEWKKMVPNGPTMLWITESEANKRRKSNADSPTYFFPTISTQEQRDKADKAILTKIEYLKEKKFAGVDMVQIHTYLTTESQVIKQSDVDPFIPSDKALIKIGDELRAGGILFQSLPWGGHNEGVYKKLLDLGVMAFATDFPDTNVKAVDEYYKDKKK